MSQVTFDLDPVLSVTTTKDLEATLGFFSEERRCWARPLLISGMGTPWNLPWCPIPFNKWQWFVFTVLARKLWVCACTHMTYTYIDTRTETYTLCTQRGICTYTHTETQAQVQTQRHGDVCTYMHRHICTTFIHTAHSDLVRPYNWCLKNTPQMILMCNQALKTLDCCRLHCPPD